MVAEITAPKNIDVIEYNGKTGFEIFLPQIYHKSRRIFVKRNKKLPMVTYLFGSSCLSMVAEGGIIRGEIYHSMLSKQYGFDITL